MSQKDQRVHSKNVFSTQNILKQSRYWKIIAFLRFFSWVFFFYSSDLCSGLTRQRRAEPVRSEFCRRTDQAFSATCTVQRPGSTGPPTAWRARARVRGEAVTKVFLQSRKEPFDVTQLHLNTITGVRRDTHTQWKRKYDDCSAPRH